MFGFLFVGGGGGEGGAGRSMFGEEEGRRERHSLYINQLTRSNTPLPRKVGRIGIFAQGLDRSGLCVGSSSRRHWRCSREAGEAGGLRNGAGGKGNMPPSHGVVGITKGIVPLNDKLHTYPRTSNFVEWAGDHI